MLTIINNFSSEYLQSELPMIEVLKELGYEYIDGTTMDRDISSVILENELINSIKRLNPSIDEDNLKKVIKIIITPKETDLMLINQEIYNYFIKGIAIPQDLGNGKKNQTVKLFDYDNSENNSYKVVNQFRLKLKEKIGIYEKDIPDVIIFINGLPISVIECKTSTVENTVKKGINQILRYHNELPKLFWYSNLNIFCAGSYGLLYGTTNTLPQYYQEWKTYFPYESKEQSKQNIKSISTPTPPSNNGIRKGEKRSLIECRGVCFVLFL